MSKFKKMMFKVNNLSHSEDIQKRLFSLGYEWADGTRKVQHTAMPYLFTGSSYGHITHCSVNPYEDDPKNGGYKETTLYQLIKEATCPQQATKDCDTKSKQVGGQHYTLKAIQPWDIIKAWDLDFYRGNVIKYVLRAPFKNGVEDIEKAIHYLEHIRDNYKEIFKDGI